MIFTKERHEFTSQAAYEKALMAHFSEWLDSDSPGIGIVKMPHPKGIRIGTTDTDAKDYDPKFAGFILPNANSIDPRGVVYVG